MSRWVERLSTQVWRSLYQRETRSFIVVALLSAMLVGCGGRGSNPEPVVITSPPVTPPPPLPPPPPEPPTSNAQPCENGQANEFACLGISLRSQMPLDELGGESGNDIWGWHDADTNREYALIGLNNGTAFVDISDPDNPVFLGRLPTQSGNSIWRDIKVYRNYAYVVADHAGAHGMQVFDLTRLRDQATPQEFVADTVYGDFENAHNLAINENTGFIYASLSNTCEAGLHMIDLSIPNNPQFAGCHMTVRTHDSQCVVYSGTDSDYVDRELCFSSNEDHFEVVDVTEKSSPMTISSLTYEQLGYVHQGWLTEDHRYFLLGDELDEVIFAQTTRTHVIDILDLDAPAYLYAYEHETEATDHNLYVLGNRIFQANYTVGLRVLEFDDLASQEMTEIAFFDTFPQHDDVSQNGAWSVYPYLPSGNIIVSDIQNGLFVLSLE